MITWLLKTLYKLLRFLTKRLVIISLLILLQVALLVLMILRLSTYSLWFALVFYLLGIAVGLWVLVKEDSPSYKIAWIVFIMALPFTGGAFYLLLGKQNISKRRRKVFADYVRKFPQLFSYEAGASSEVAQQYPKYAIQSNYIHNVSGFPPMTNTAVSFCPLGEDQFAAMTRELEKAERFIFLEYFIIEEGQMWDTILEILERKAAAGVEVRLLYDDMGCIQTLPFRYDHYLASKGIHAIVFNPFRPSVNPYMNYRDHRKICVIDGNVGFCGGANLADEYINVREKYGHWKDTAVMLRGEGVWNLTRMFLQLWNSVSKKPDTDISVFRPTVPAQAPGFVQPYPDTPLDDFRVAESVYMQIINRASRYVYITTPYLILDSDMTNALTMAAQSGVDIRILTPHVPDKWFVHIVTRSNYRTLLEAGVKIYEYTPGFIHAKMFVCDDSCAVVGTANLDYRSLYLHHECAAFIVGNPVIGDIKQDVLDTISVSRPVTLQEMLSQSLFKRIVSAFFRLFAPLM